MNRFFYLIDKFKYGIVAVLVAVTSMFMYLELSTYPQYVEIKNFHEDVNFIEEKDEIELKAENLEISPDFQSGKVTNAVRDMKDTREKSEKDYSTTKEMADGEKFARETEQRYKDEARGSSYNKEVADLIAERKKNNDKLKETKNNSTSGEKSNTGGKTAPPGNVMVEYRFPIERAPHQNDIWFVRNPGYTCGSNSSGRVVVDIKVGQDGRVISAVYNAAQSTSANSCMQEQAVKYAKMSRFEITTDGIQNGKIFYTFVSQ